MLSTSWKLLKRLKPKIGMVYEFKRDQRIVAHVTPFFHYSDSYMTHISLIDRTVGGFHLLLEWFIPTIYVDSSGKRIDPRRFQNALPQVA